MSITSSRTVAVQFSGDITGGIIQSALDNVVSPAENLPVRLSVGDNSIASPIVSGIVVTGLTIIPPPANTSLITLKGDNADVGIPLHKTDPTSIALDETFVSLVLNVPVQIDGVRLIWS